MRLLFPLVVAAALAASVRAQTTFTVTSTGDTNDGACDAHCTLREAIVRANQAPGSDVILFAAALDGETIRFTGGHLALRDRLRIDAEGPSITVQGSRVGQVRVFFVPPGSVVELVGLTIRGGRGVTGGAILNRGALTLSNCVLTRNFATGGAPRDGSGGAVHNGEGASLTLVNTTVIRNQARTWGGGLSNEGTLTLEGSTVRRNRALEYAGGGVQNSGVLIVERSTISGNVAAGPDGSGGGLSTLGSATVTNSTIAGNGARFIGGVDGSYGALSIANSIVAGNFQSGPSPSDCYVVGGTYTSDGHNVFGAATGCPGSGPGDVAVAPSEVFTRVLEADLADNGGPTPTHALRYRTDNPALDIGGTCGPVDQRGFPAPVDGPDADGDAECDAGAVEQEGTAVASAPMSSLSRLPETVALHGAQPNPFSGHATLGYDLPAASQIRLSVYDVLGREVAVLVDGPMEAGRHEAVLDGARLPSGTYLVRLEAAGRALTRRVTVVH